MFTNTTLALEAKTARRELQLWLQAMSGSEKLKLIVISKSEDPCSFKGIKFLEVYYEYKKKAWMTSEIYDK